MAGKGFLYHKTDKVYVSYFDDGKWDDGALVDSDQINLSLMSTVFHYGQSVFEGLKAYRRKDGHVQIFRVKDNAARMKGSCERIVMPVFPEERFINAVIETVQANLSYVPAYREGTLYIRPVLFGVGDNLGLKPSKSYVFAIIVSPVGSYFDSQQKPMTLVTSKYDRVASKGTGQAKTGGNYASSMLPQKLAREQGYQDVLFLDPVYHQNIEEVGAANFIGITASNEIHTPYSESILNGITKRSVLYIATHLLNMHAEERVIALKDLSNYVEAAACGTATVITPIGSVTHDEIVYHMTYHDKIGPIISKLYDLLTGIQYGDIEDPDHWITVVS